MKDNCERYGHCYCGETQGNGVPHKVCCKCRNQRVGQLSLARSFRNERRAILQCPANALRLID